MPYVSCKCRLSCAPVTHLSTPAGAIFVHISSNVAADIIVSSLFTGMCCSFVSCNRTAMPPLTGPLCTLACCSTLTSLSLSSVDSKLGQCDFMLIGRLRGLQDLTLRFPGPSAENSRLCFSPITQLTNLQRLVVRGLSPVAPQPAAAAVGAAAVAGAAGAGAVAAAVGAAAVVGAAAAGGDGGSSSLRDALPSSLTSLVLEGHGCDDDDEEGSTVKGLQDWMSMLRPGLQELQIVNYPDCRGYMWNHVKFGMLPQLRELRVLVAPNEDLTNCSRLALHSSVCLLTSLKVLEVGNFNWQLPTVQHCFHLPGLEGGLLQELTGLKSVGWVCNTALERVPQEQPIPLEELRCYIGPEALPEWMTAASCPQLKRLLLETDRFSDAVLQSVAALTQVTFLRFDTAIACMDDNDDIVSWASLGVVGRSLPVLQRLELVNVNEEQPAEEPWVVPPLAMPDLSTFTQIKQLQLVCEMHPEKDVPEQPSSSDFLQGLSKLTQLEQLQLEGYSTVTPAVVCCLGERLPQLQLLEVGLCQHPELLKAANVEDEADVSWPVVHPGFVEVQELCRIMRPSLQLKMGYARQWL